MKKINECFELFSKDVAFSGNQINTQEITLSRPELSGYVPGWFNCQQTVTHLSSNRDRRSTTSLIETTHYHKVLSRADKLI